MTILTHNLYRLLVRDLEIHNKLPDQAVFENFIENGTDIKIKENEITVRYKKKKICHYY
jgi:hypothetical protein